MLTQTITYDQAFLEQFEEGLDPLDPEHSRIPARVLGYGEMSTVMTISGADPGLVFKRMPMFQSESELEPYLALYDGYLEHMIAAGIVMVPAAITSVTSSSGDVVAYIIQEKLDSRTLVNKAIHTCSDVEVERLFAAIVDSLGQVFAYNSAHKRAVEIGIDAQMSNWAIINYDVESGTIPDPVELIYIDTSSPLLRLNGEEQLDPELFMRSAPSFLRWVLRLLYLEDMLNRYYDRRQVTIDIVANLYKEKRTEVIPTLLAQANEFLVKNSDGEPMEPITEREVAGYYKEDARIWTVYLGFRRIDRWIHRALGKPYPYVLPGRVER